MPLANTAMFPACFPNSLKADSVLVLNVAMSGVCEAASIKLSKDEYTGIRSSEFHRSFVHRIGRRQKHYRTKLVNGQETGQAETNQKCTGPSHRLPRQGKRRRRSAPTGQCWRLLK